MYKRFLMSDISYGEPFRIFAFEVLEIQLYLTHLAVNVTVGNDCAGALNQALVIVCSIKKYGYAGLLGYIIEPLFPFRSERTGALGSDAQVECLGHAGCFRKVVGHACVL